MQDSSLSVLRKGKVLGQGSIGRVYSVVRKRQPLAMKVEYILPDSVENGGQLDNEVIFATTVASRFPDKFMQMLDFDIVPNCKESLKPVPKHLPKGMQKRLARARKGKVCALKLYSLVHTTLSNVMPFIRRWSMPHRYSVLLQLIDILRIMDKTGWVHGDFHPGNIGIKRTWSKRLVTIGDTKRQVKTYGTLVQSIDYGDALNRRTLRKNRPFQGDIKETELQHYKQHKVVDRFILFDILYDFEGYWKFVNRNKIQLDFHNDKKKVMKLAEYKSLKTDKRFAKLPDDLLFKMTHLLYPEQVERAVLGEHYSHVIKPHLNVPLKEILYAFENFRNNEKLLTYFLRKYDDATHQ